MRLFVLFQFIPELRHLSGSIRKHTRYIFMLPKLSLCNYFDVSFNMFDIYRDINHDIIVMTLVSPCDVCQNEVELGELLLSLNYLPSAGRLNVDIIRAKQLLQTDMCQGSGKCLSVCLTL